MIDLIARYNARIIYEILIVRYEFNYKLLVYIMPCDI